ncbi:uncharacterized protein LOC119458993 [Dermacentor silvarum]|uniref:uncharacterized protein LOC119458993 n=1 Tax=Dermacentor silvarum TaxID=543639 RepID=UPI002100D5B0|nr:uncharacterized protein LOC119458993 [Dermacentor silvarum]
MSHDQPATPTSSVQVPATPTPSASNNRYRNPEIFPGLPGEDVQDWLDSYDRAGLQLNVKKCRFAVRALTILVRLPQYWDQHPSVWFLQAESQLQVAGIRSQASKFYYAFAALSPAAIDEKEKLVNAPLSTAAYDDLKAALLQRTVASQRSRIQQLLSTEVLGDRRPSQLLRRIRQLLGDNAGSIDDALWRELFLQRLPANVQMVLATASTMDLNGLAVLADTVMEEATSTIAATTSSQGGVTTALQTLPCSSAAQSPLDSLYVRRALTGADFLHNYGLLVDVQRRRLIDSVT